MFRENIAPIIIALAIIVGAVVLRPVANSALFQTMGYDGVVYRLNQKSGRMDVLVPTSEGALMIPVGQISSPISDKMNDSEKKQFSSFIKTIAQYIQIERAKSLGLSVSQPSKVPTDNK